MIEKPLRLLPLIGVLFTLVQASELPRALTDDDFYPIDMDQARLGQLLFYDPVLSGNRNIACSTCHHPDFGTSDGLSLGIGEGGNGLGPQRTAGSGDSRVKKRIPRNAPGLFNLGFRGWDVLFHDGRLSTSDFYDSGFDSPALEFLPTDLRNIVAAQALFPITSEFEMAGDTDENEVLGAVRRRIDYGWRVLAERVRGVGGYEPWFQRAFDDVDGSADIRISHIANALAAFMEFEWRADDSPFDRYLRGDETALTDEQKDGMHLFYSEAQCSGCHSGPLQSDQQFHGLGLPPLGPGRTRAFDHKARDMGRINETDRLADRYHFRTPSLRNVAATAPYGHNGAYATLDGIIRHHLNPEQALDRYDRTQLVLIDDDYLNRHDFLVWQDAREMAAIRDSISIDIPERTDAEIRALVAFLESLSDATSLGHRLGIPESVPSGLPVDRSTVEEQIQPVAAHHQDDEQNQ